MLPSPPFSSFHLGPLTIHLYGLIIAGTILLCYEIARRRAKQFLLSEKILDNIFLITIPIAFLGARILHILTNLPYYQKHPIKIVALWEGGLGILGAIITGLLTLLFLARKYHLPFFQLTNLFAPILALGQSLGRWGNYFNQELYGTPTKLPWALYITPEKRLPNYSNYTTFHPIFLYESILNLLNFLILTNLHKIQNLPHLTSIFRNLTPTSLYLINYGLIRLFIENLKLDPDIQTFFAGLRTPQWLSLLLILTGIFIWIIQHQRRST
jgi:phosphatidylglycerol:prolipoprotein diacylglycerol transferase